MAADLLTFQEFLDRAGRDSTDLDVAETARAHAAIAGASSAIRAYVDRDLTLNADAVQGARTFRYYGHTLLEIDDCKSVTSVSTASTPWQPFTRVLSLTEYIPGPFNAPVLTYIELHTILPFGNSPEMGFMWNADRYGFIPRPIEISVDAVWGWPAIPEDIKWAAVWVVGELMTSISPYTVESIEGYSHSFGSGRSQSLVPQTAITVRAQSLLDPYIRINV